MGATFTIVFSMFLVQYGAFVCYGQYDGPVWYRQYDGPLRSSVAIMKKAYMSRYHLLEDKTATSSVISTFIRRTRRTCALECIKFDTCESFFYDSVSGECQLHNYTFMTTEDTIDQPGLQYYYIVKGRNDWCPVEDGYQLLSEEGPCVKLHNDRMTWYDANETCVSYYPPYSRLVILDNNEKNELVKAAGVALNKNKYFRAGLWIGLIEYAQDEYGWVDGRELNFTDWSKIDNSDPLIEDCVWRNRAYGWHWRRMPCTQSGHYICEIEINLTLYHSMMTLP